MRFTITNKSVIRAKMRPGSIDEAEARGTFPMS